MSLFVNWKAHLPGTQIMQKWLLFKLFTEYAFSYLRRHFGVFKEEATMANATKTSPQNRTLLWVSVISLEWHEGFPCQGRVWKISCFGLALWSKSQTSCLKISRGRSAEYDKEMYLGARARAAWLFFLFQPIISFICGIVAVAVGVAVSLNSMKYLHADNRYQLKHS